MQCFNKVATCVGR